MPADRVVFWDFDGTLGYRPEGWAGTLAALLAEHDPGCGVSRDDIRPFLAAGFPWHTPEVPHPELGHPDRFWQHLQPVFVRAYVANGVGAKLARRLAAAVRDRYLDPRTYALYEDTIPTLTAFAELGWRQALITNNVPELPAVLEQLGLTRLIEHVTNSGSVGYEKPHPEIYRLALAAAGHPTVTWMVGDNAVADVLGAERAGIRGVLVRQRDGQVRQSCADLREALRLITGED